MGHQVIPFMKSRLFSDLSRSHMMILWLLSMLTTLPMLHAIVDRYYYELLGLQGNLAEGNLNLGQLEEGYREQSLKW
jgi:hypothetical protein